MHPRVLKTDYAVNPLYLDCRNFNLSWQLGADEPDASPSAFRVLAAGSPEKLTAGSADWWDSGECLSSDSSVRYAGRPLSSFDRVYWTVAVRDARGRWSEFAAPAYFECALFDEADWREACWIGAGPEDEPQADVTRFAEESYVKTLPVTFEERAPYLRREFRLADRPVRARVYFCGLGICDFSVNGSRANDTLFAPARSDYRKRLFYEVCDITALLREGENRFDAVLGNGWFNSAPKWWSWRMQWFGHPKLRLLARFEYADGRVEYLRSDADWRYLYGAEQANCLYDGSRYDARLEPERRMDAVWCPIHLVPAPGGRMEAAAFEPERVVETIEPVRLQEPAPGVWVADFGKEISGRVRIRVRGGKGHTVKIHYAEAVHPDGSLDFRSNNLALATDTYTLAGDSEGEEWEPRFAMHGFRYAEFTGWPGTPDTGDIDARVIYSDCREIGHFQCSDRLLNKIFDCSMQSLRINFHGFPGDCTQRDERQGWIGDAHVIAQTALFGFDLNRLYRKYMGDIANAQTEEGRLPFIVPWPLLQEDMPWSSGYFIIAWQLYLHNGDRTILERNYESMRRYLGFLDTQAESWVQPPAFWGDHLCVEDGWEIGKGMPNSMSDSFYYLDTVLLARIARAIGKEEEVQRLTSNAEQIAQAFFGRYFHADSGIVEQPGQSAAGFALAMLPFAPEDDAKALNALLENIFSVRKGHVSTGLIGTAYLIEALDRRGRYPELWKLIHRGGYPGWAEMLAGDITAIPEDWQLHRFLSRSRCHVPLGAVSAWFFRRLAGIDPTAEAPGFGLVEMRPYFPPDLRWVEASVDTVRGRIGSAWHREGDHVTWTVTLPPNAKARVVFPETSGRAAEEIGSGTRCYEFCLSDGKKGK